MTQICPWCQMEITWDEELGPEETCPHCYNEMSEYRTMTIPIKRDADAAGSDEDEDEGEEEEWNRYARTAEQILEGQEDAPECPQCKEYMVHAGEQSVTGGQFTPTISAFASSPFLLPPFRMEVFVCSHCFTMLHRLSEGDRKALVRRLANEEEA